MKKASQQKAGFLRYENQIHSAIMIMIVLVSFSLFAVVTWQFAKYILG